MANGMQERKLTPQQRAELFALHTRQHMQMLPSQTAQAGETVSFTIPKTRLLAGVKLLVEANVNVIHAANNTFTPAMAAPFNILRRVSLDINNGFSPFVVSGADLYLYNLARDKANIMTRADLGRGKVVMGAAADTQANGGADNRVSFVADLQNVLNERDPIGLILAQNQETVITITVDIANDLSILSSAPTGYTFTLTSLRITPMVVTFSIPAVAQARPDITILKLVQTTTESIAGAGEQVVKLPVGQTYRKLVIYITDNDGAGVLDTAISGNFELVFNQADTPYSIKPAVLAALNHEQFGVPLPNGIYVFDFSYQGISGYGGLRDYVDTENLTEFWFRFQAPGAGEVRVVHETLARLRGE